MAKSKMNRRFSSFSKAGAVALWLCAAPALRVGADSLWKPDTTVSMFADKKAHAVGDIITILVQENNGATRNNNTTTSKKSSVDSSISSFFYSPGASSLLTKGGTLPALKFSGDSEFNGGGQINNTETITARLPVRVIDVLPNGNMLVEGHRQTAFSGEKMDAILRGTVRADDLSANNTVYSYNVADATITFVGKGTLSDTQRKGWFQRVWDKVSPF